MMELDWLTRRFGLVAVAGQSGVVSSRGSAP